MLEAAGEKKKKKNDYAINILHPGTNRKSTRGETGSSFFFHWHKQMRVPQVQLAPVAESQLDGSTSSGSVALFIMHLDQRTGQPMLSLSTGTWE